MISSMDHKDICNASQFREQLFDDVFSSPLLNIGDSLIDVSVNCLEGKKSKESINWEDFKDYFSINITKKDWITSILLILAKMSVFSCNISFTYLTRKMRNNWIRKNLLFYLICEHNISNVQPASFLLIIVQSVFVTSFFLAKTNRNYLFFKNPSI